MPRRSWFRKLRMRNLTFGRRNNLVNVKVIHVKPYPGSTPQDPQPIPVNNIRNFLGKCFPFLLPKKKVIPTNNDDAVADAGKNDGGNNGEGDQRQVEKDVPNGSLSDGEKFKLLNMPALERLSKMLPSVEKYDPSSITHVIDPDNKEPITLGSGAFGVVKLVGTEDRRLRALKHIRCTTDEYRKEAHIEAGVMSMLQSSPYFPKIFGVLDDNEGVNILMELIHLHHSVIKLTIADLCRQDEILPSHLESTEILEKVATALQFMHQCGLLHNDLASRNVMLHHSFSGNYEVKIVDFGFVCPIDTPSVRCTDGRFKDEVGKKRFLHRHSEIAPELLNGTPHTVATDIFALGSIIEEISNYYSGIDSFEQLANHCRDFIPENRVSIANVLIRLHSIKKNKSFDQVPTANGIAAAPTLL